MLEGLEFIAVAVLAVCLCWISSNALVLLAMYYGRKVILKIVRDQLT